MDLILVIAYFVVMLLVGWKSRHLSADAYWVAERSYRGGRIAVSLTATVFGASSTMGIIGLGYSRGLTGAWWSLVGGLALIPFGFFLASRVRELKVYTLPDILKRAYGDRVAVPAGLMIAVAWCGVVAAQLVAGGRLIAGLSPLDFQASLAIVAVVFTLYTFWGGQLSVIRTDLWQLVLFVGGLAVSLTFLAHWLLDAPALFENVPQDHWRFPVSKGFGWYEVLVFYPLIVGLPFLVGPDIYSRVLCAKDGRGAKRASFQAAAAIIPLSFVLVFFGLMARAAFPEIPAESALPEVLNTLIPIGLRGLIVAGFLGAIMSSADTCLLSASTILTLNVFGPVFGKNRPKELRITRVTVLFLGAAAWIIAGSQKGIISSLLLGYTVFVGGVVFPTLATFLQGKIHVTPAGALWAIVIGGGTAILGKIQGGIGLRIVLTASGHHFLQGILGGHYASLLPIILSISVMLLVSRFR